MALSVEDRPKFLKAFDLGILAKKIWFDLPLEVAREVSPCDLAALLNGAVRLDSSDDAWCWVDSTWMEHVKPVWGLNLPDGGIVECVYWFGGGRHRCSVTRDGVTTEEDVPSSVMRQIDPNGAWVQYHSADTFPHRAFWLGQHYVEEGKP